jgi:glycosyltransferase involved in cell wall biosynthesis
LLPINDYYYISDSFFYNNKKKWITWVARLKDWDDFLFYALESYLPIVDELILVDNNSSDKTVSICKDFLKRYPSKVKFYHYKKEIFWAATWIETSNTNPNSLSYFYNRCFSKANYSHVIKIDDDNIAISSQYKILRKKILKENKPWLYATWWLNIFIKNNKIWVYWNYPFSWKYWDHGIYKITPKTYYVQNWDIENLSYPYRRISYNFAFIHLKHAKKDFWFYNIRNKEIRKNLIRKTKDSQLLSLNSFLEWESLLNVYKILKKIFPKKDFLIN